MNVDLKFPLYTIQFMRWKFTSELSALTSDNVENFIFVWKVYAYLLHY